MSKLASLAVAALVLAGATPLMAEDVVITQYKADPSGAPYGVAIDQGFFKKAGIDITGVISGAGARVRAQRHRQRARLRRRFASAVIAAVEQGQDIKIVAQGSRSLADNVVIVMPNSPIKSVNDLKGKKFAISNPKSLGEMTAVLVFEQAGLKPDDVQRVALGGLSGALTALENGVVDATSIPGILFLSRGGESKYRVLLGPKDLPLLPPAIGMASGDLMKKHPEKLRALLAGRRAGVKFIYEHTDDAIKILSKVYEPLPPKDASGDAGQPAGGRQVLERRSDRDAGSAECGPRHEICRIAGEGHRSRQDDRHVVPAERPAGREAMSDRPPVAEVHAQLTGVTRVFPPVAGHPSVHALGPVDLELRKGEFFAVVGPSGCGKSTLLEVLAGLQRPTAGAVAFEGSPWAARSPMASASCSGGRELSWLTVWDNAAFGLRRRGAADAEVRRRVDDAWRSWGSRILPGLSVATVRRYAPARVHRAHPGAAAASHFARRAVRRARCADPPADG
jgi:NitT/TauT family transport system substrate-binding protein